MKWMLISLMLNGPITYTDENLCRVALKEVKTQDSSAICIPAGENEQDQMFDKFLDMINRLKAMETKPNA
jgi:hypothetical protein